MCQQEWGPIWEQPQDTLWTPRNVAETTRLQASQKGAGLESTPRTTANQPEPCVAMTITLGHLEHWALADHISDFQAVGASYCNSHVHSHY